MRISSITYSWTKFPSKYNQYNWVESHIFLRLQNHNFIKKQEYHKKRVLCLRHNSVMRIDTVLIHNKKVLLKTLINKKIEERQCNVIWEQNHTEPMITPSTKK